MKTTLYISGEKNDGDVFGFFFFFLLLFCFGGFLRQKKRIHEGDNQK